MTKLKTGMKWRYVGFIAILALMFTYLVSGLVNLQLRQSDVYSEKAESGRTKTIYLRGKRGNITDADSVILAEDEWIYNVTFYKDASETSRQNYHDYTESIINSLEIIHRNGGELAFDYVIQRSEETGEWEFNFGTGVSDSVLEKRESQWRSNNYVSARYYPTAADCIAKLKKNYRIVQSEEEREARVRELFGLVGLPSSATRRKKDSSMAVMLRMLRDGEGDACISAGSTGALLTGATLIVKRVRGIRRAASQRTMGSRPSAIKRAAPIHTRSSPTLVRMK